MKVRLNKKTLAALPQPIRMIVEKWRVDMRKTSICVNAAAKFYIEEDATFTAFGPDMRSVTVRAGGEWAGVTALMPGSHCPLPAGCTVIARGFFCGQPWLTIYHNPAQVLHEMASLVALVGGAERLPLNPPALVIA